MPKVTFNHTIPYIYLVFRYINFLLLKYSYDYPAIATGYPALRGTLALPAVLWLVVAGAT